MLRDSHGGAHALHDLVCCRRMVPNPHAAWWRLQSGRVVQASRGVVSRRVASYLSLGDHGLSDLADGEGGRSLDIVPLLLREGIDAESESRGGTRNACTARAKQEPDAHEDREHRARTIQEPHPNIALHRMIAVDE